MVPLTLSLKAMVVMVAPEQTACDAGVLITFGAGFISTVAVMGVPVQPLAVGVMVNVILTGAVVVFVKEPLILPDPLATIPVTETVLFLVQLYTVPLTPPPLNAMGVIVAPEQIVCDDGVATAAFGTGFTSTVAVMGVPVQPLAIGVMVNVTVTGEAVVFVNAPVILPDPLAAIPVTETVLFLVQLYIVPLTPPFNAIGVNVAPEQIVCVDGVAIAFGLGFTSTAALLVQPPDDAVIVNVTYTGAVVVFVKAPEILPDPLAAIPVTEAVLFLVQL